MAIHASSIQQKAFEAVLFAEPANLPLAHVKHLTDIVELHNKIPVDPILEFQLFDIRVNVVQQVCYSVEQLPYGGV